MIKLIKQDRLFSGTQTSKKFLVVNKKGKILKESNSRKEAAQFAAANNKYKIMKQNSFNFEDDS